MIDERVFFYLNLSCLSFPSLSTSLSCLNYFSPSAYLFAFASLNLLPRSFSLPLPSPPHPLIPYYIFKNFVVPHYLYPHSHISLSSLILFTYVLIRCSLLSVSFISYYLADILSSLTLSPPFLSPHSLLQYPFLVHYLLHLSALRPPTCIHSFPSLSHLFALFSYASMRANH